jgi:hypothetical protein
LVLRGGRIGVVGGHAVQERPGVTTESVAVGRAVWRRLVGRRGDGCHGGICTAGHSQAKGRQAVAGLPTRQCASRRRSG